MNLNRYVTLVALILHACVGQCRESTPAADLNDIMFCLQSSAASANRCAAAHWGIDPANYMEWGAHSNRLIPIYTFGTTGSVQGVDLNYYLGTRSVYRSANRLRLLYGDVPAGTLNSAAKYCDQTDVARLQLAALAAGRKYIFLIIFDGMDWQCTRTAAIYNAQADKYNSGRGSGLHFQDYTARGTSQFGFMVTSPYANGAKFDVDRQHVTSLIVELTGGYNAERGGSDPWTSGADPEYLISKNTNDSICHAYPDSASSATSMSAGIKTYNGAINVDRTGRQFLTVAHQAQASGFAVGAVTSVAISHATPAATYAHNVYRDDYQDLTRDLLGLPSVAHPERPLPGLDVLVGCGFGVNALEDQAQGANFQSGNIYLTEADRHAIDTQHGGRYVVVQRTAGAEGGRELKRAAAQAAVHGRRLFGFYGTKYGRLPFATADGDYKPSPGRAAAESYTPADIAENPTLAEMTQAAITVLVAKSKGFWLMIEAGDVDSANHDNNLDNSIGAVLSGDAAVRVVTDWVEANSDWNESLVIVTADHGHYLSLEQPAALIAPGDASSPIPLDDSQTDQTSFASELPRLRANSLPREEVARLAGTERFKVYESNPVLSPGERGEWDAGAIGSMTVVQIGDLLHMYYEAWAANENETDLDFSSLQIGHAVSIDGIHWQKDPANPVVAKGSAGDWDADGTWDPFVIQEDGVFKLWYGGGIDRHCDYGFAESIDGSRFEKRGRFSSIGQLSDGHVVRESPDSHYLLYYFDKRFEPRNSLFRAASAAETGFDFSAARPIIIDGESPNSMVKFSQVFVADGAWYMLYANFVRPSAADSSTRLARSDDGVHWKCVNKNLFAGHDAEVMSLDDSLHLAYFSRRGSYNQPKCDVQLAIYRGSWDRLHDQPIVKPPRH